MRRLSWISWLVPLRWRATVLRDLMEEADRTGRRPASPWMFRQVLAIACRLQLRRISDALPSRRGLFTGFLSGDFRGAIRQLRRSPSTTLVSIVTLSVAVAAVLTILAVLNRTVLHPLNFGDTSRLTAVWRVDPASPDNWLNVSRGDFVDWARDATSFDSLVAAQNISMTFSGFEDGGAPLMRRVTHGWFETLSVTPVLGRTFSREEDTPNGPPVAMLSYKTWQERFEGRADVVGRTVELDNVAYSIVGVTPQSYFNPVFGLIDEPEAFLPLALADAGEPRGIAALLAIGRLTPDVTLAQADQELRRLSENQAQAFPATNRQFRATVQPLDEQIVRPLRTPLMLVLVAVVGLFIAACGNVANLQLARALGRRQEFAVQQALGASRLRLLLQMFAEGIILAGLAGSAALWLTALAGTLIERLVPVGALMPRVTFDLDRSALWMAAVVTGVAALLSSVPAMLTVLRRVNGSELGAGAVKAIGGRERRRWASALVALEMTVAVTLLSGAGLALLGFQQIRNQPPGFTADGALTFRVSTRGPDLQSPEARTNFFERVREELEGIPGVTAVGPMSGLPIFTQFGERAAYRADIAPPAPGDEPRVSTVNIGPGFLDALGVPLLSGRDFTPDDRMNAPAVALLSRSAAQALFGRDEAVGRAIEVVEGTQIHRVDVVGVVGDVRTAVDPSVVGRITYLPWLQRPINSSMGFVVRSTEDPALMTRQAEQAVHRVNKAMPLYLARPLTAIAASLESTYRLTASLLGAFAVLGLLLVATGLYGTIAHLVADRRRELGVRVALGATRRRVLELVLREGLRPAVVGVAIGSGLALVFGRLVATAVAGTPAFDWSLFLGLPLTLVALSILASLAPALRATRVDPTTALRID